MLSMHCAAGRDCHDRSRLFYFTSLDGFGY